MLSARSNLMRNELSGTPVSFEVASPRAGAAFEREPHDVAARNARNSVGLMLFTALGVNA